MPNTSFLISIPVGILGFLFVFWRNLKEDYPSNQIFSFAFIVTAFGLTGLISGILLNRYFLVNNLLFDSTNLWFWSMFVSGSAGFLVASSNLKIRFFETLEATSLGFIFFFFIICLFYSIQKVDLKLLVFSLFLATLFPISNFLQKRYKSFSWYKSGKIGFCGLAILTILFAVRLVVALLLPGMLSFIGKIDAVADVSVAFLFFLLLYYLSQI